MKVNILFKPASSPAGGGNQFLNLLKDFFCSRNVYTDLPRTAEVILFNSHHNIGEVAKIRLKYPDKIFIHRIDGPMKVYNDLSDIRDDIVFAANEKIADATVFQSGWSQSSNHEVRLSAKSFETVIYNATDSSVFNMDGKIAFSKDRKIRLIAASWSPNWNKGFETYKWLDENLDFGKYQMAFIGNSPVNFKNIEKLPPMDSKRLASQLKQNDIFIFASPIEACSNLLLEALYCGLPVIAPNSSSNPEIVQTGGQLFNSPTEIPALLEDIAGNYERYVNSIKAPSVDNVGKAYYDFAEKVHAELKQTSRNKFGNLDYLQLVIQIFFLKAINKFRCICTKQA